jgi:hypothetical protein
MTVRLVDLEPAFGQVGLGAVFQVAAVAVRAHVEQFLDGSDHGLSLSDRVQGRPPNARTYSGKSARTGASLFAVCRSIAAENFSNQYSRWRDLREE